MATTFTELLKAVKKSDPKFENLKVAETEPEFSARLLTAVGTLSDEAWASLPVDDQNWFNAAAAQLNAGEPVTIPGFDLSLADGAVSEDAVVEDKKAPAKAKGKSDKAVAAEAAKVEKAAAAEKAKADKAAEKLAKAEAAKAENAAKAKAEKPAKEVKEKVSSYKHVPSVDGSVPATLFLRQVIIKNYMAGTETDGKGLAAAAASAGVVVNESTINTVFNHALGTLRAMDSLGLTIVKQ